MGIVLSVTCQSFTKLSVCTVNWLLFLFVCIRSSASFLLIYLFFVLKTDILTFNSQSWHYMFQCCSTYTQTDMFALHSRYRFKYLIFMCSQTLGVTPSKDQTMYPLTRYQTDKDRDTWTGHGLEMLNFKSSLCTGTEILWPVEQWHFIRWGWRRCPELMWPGLIARDKPTTLSSSLRLDIWAKEDTGENPWKWSTDLDRNYISTKTEPLQRGEKKPITTHMVVSTLDSVCSDCFQLSID